MTNKQPKTLVRSLVEKYDHFAFKTGKWILDALKLKKMQKIRVMCSGGSLDPRQEMLYPSIARLQPEADPPLAEKPSRYNISHEFEFSMIHYS
ncbi:hypothetical protein KKB83_03795 [Patescibacteria group bacterium]|nr:hypothetical protein [Patescibacteria group bacterium]